MDVIVEVRRPDRSRAGQIADEFLDLTFAAVLNNLGAWKLLLPAEHSLVPVLREEGAGVVITFEGRVFSGPMRSADLVQDASDPVGTWAFAGLSDEIALLARGILPDPSREPDDQTTLMHDLRAGVGETVFKQLVNLNAGPGALPRRRALTVTPDLGRGAYVESRARFANLLEHLAGRAVTASLGFTVTQQGDELVFDVFEPRDRSKFIRMDIINGGLASSGWGFAAPSATEVWVAGQGEGVERTVEVVTTPEADAEADLWGIRFEVFKDQRQTDEISELVQAGLETLTELGSTVRSIKVEPSDSPSMQVGRDWWLGDLVTVSVAGQDAVAQVTQVGVRVNSDGVTVQAVVGDPTGLTFESRMIAKSNAQEQRISELERNSESGAFPQPMRLPFPTLAALNAFTGWPGLIGFVEADDSEYVWRDGWKLWSRPWQAYTPTWTNLTVGNGTVTATYMVAAGLVKAAINLNFGSTTSMSGIFYPSHPVPVAGTNSGSAWAYDVSQPAASAFFVGVYVPSAYMLFPNGRALATFPFTWAVGDLLRLEYTAAAA